MIGTATGTQREEPSIDPPSPIAVVWVTQIGSTVRTLIRYSALAYAAFCLFQTAQALAGRSTGASIVVSLLANFKTTCGLSLVGGGLGVAYGYGQKRLRNRVTKARSLRQQGPRES